MTRFIALLALALLLASPALAQDAESTPVVEVTPIVIPGDTGDATIIFAPSPTTDAPRPLIDTDSALTIVIAIAGSILLGGGGLMILSRFLKRKDVRDVVESKFIAQPPQTQESILGVVAALDKALGMLKDMQDFAHGVTDKQTNVDPPVSNPPTP